MGRPNVFTIPPGAPFLDTLVEALIGGRLIPGFEPRDPFALADVTLYLPTRRAARAIRERFLDRAGRPLLLPRIRTLGDLDEDETGLLDAESTELPASVPSLERQLVLTRLVLGWSGALVRGLAELPDEELIVPASPADAARLASALGLLLDQVGAEPAAWRGLFSGIPADLARYWDITLEFLKIATEFWPAHLTARGMLDPGARRDLMIRGEAERLQRHGAKAPVIAAGSTGSVAATAELLAAVAALPNGAVVLPGLDQGLDAEAWAAVGPADGDPAGAGHPQFGLRRLLDSLGVRREDVAQLGAPLAPLRLRERFVSEAMRPAAATERWSDRPALTGTEKAAAVAAIGIVEAANEREEALAAAILLREAAETPDRVAALVTPDRGLARRVAVELRRWKIDVDDSGGRSLSATPPGVFARLVAEVALGGVSATPLLALLKHPLCAFGLAPPEARRAARSLERAVLRGPRLKPGLSALGHAVEQAAANRRTEPAEGSPRQWSSEAARGLSRAGWAAAEDLAARIEASLAPLERLAIQGDRIALPDLIEAHLGALLHVARDAGGSSARLFADEAGEALALAFEELRTCAPRFEGTLAAADYPGLFTALIERSVVRRWGGLDPRVHIWGALEARLQGVDVVVLGGLNEGTWPGQTRLDPLLSRPMRAALALEPPERRIGLAAHDFTQALGHPTVWLTRANRQDGEPRVASRWLQRLAAYAGEAAAKAMRTRGEGVLALARSLDSPEEVDRPQRPRPVPPVALRPRKLSATRIETLIRDPYAIYARYVLKLAPFEPLAKLPEAAERGTLIHDILEAFVRGGNGAVDAAAEMRLLEVGRARFEAFADFPEFAALWWPRFEKIARWFVRLEAARNEVVTRHVEGDGRWDVTPDFALTARADRIDRLTDGTLAIIDYKTGGPPSVDEVLSLSPQLPLEALIARRGGFDGIPAAAPTRLAYYQISGRGEGGQVHERSGRPAYGRKPAVSLAEALAATERRLGELVAHFAVPEAEYVSRKIPRRGRVYAGDYDHLARVAEWTVSEEEDDQ